MTLFVCSLVDADGSGDLDRQEMKELMQGLQVLLLHSIVTSKCTVPVYPSCRASPPLSHTLKNILHSYAHRFPHNSSCRLLFLS